MTIGKTMVVRTPTQNSVTSRVTGLVSAHGKRVLQMALIVESEDLRVKKVDDTVLPYRIIHLYLFLYLFLPSHSFTPVK